jgi:peptidoglycan-associated lipoprotein
MKLKNLSNLLPLGMALAIVATGCAKRTAPPVTQLPNSGRTGPADSGLGLGTGTPFKSESLASQETANGIPVGPGHPESDWSRDRESLREHTVYFEFDKSAIKSSEQSKLELVANYLKSNPTHAVLVEGNCDERGTEEYNRSLGERRALSSREELVRAGIDSTRIDTITYGNDKPAVQGHDESAWSKNRRDDFVVLIPKRAGFVAAER